MYESSCLHGIHTSLLLYGSVDLSDVSLRNISERKEASKCETRKYGASSLNLGWTTRDKPVTVFGCPLTSKEYRGIDDFFFFNYVKIYVESTAPRMVKVILITYDFLTLSKL